MTDQAPAIRRLLVAVDIEKYSTRTAPAQYQGQRRLLSIAQYACKRAQVHRVIPQESGDGRLMVFQPGVNEAAVVPALVLGFRHALHENNGDAGEFGRMRLRMAIVEGATAYAGNGFHGPAPILVGDLINAPRLKAALDEHRESDLALVVPNYLYADLISQNYPGLSREHFSPFPVELRHDQVERAWIHLPRSAPAPDPRAPKVRWDGMATAITVQGLFTAGQVYYQGHLTVNAGSVDDSPAGGTHSGHHQHGHHNHHGPGLGHAELPDELFDEHPEHDGSDVGGTGSEHDVSSHWYDHDHDDDHDHHQQHDDDQDQ
ncbi:hypothetical protein [Micromonospora sp. WMMD714]|uniref:hypothetical protein n=1 Tax=Micromonospora sp. WMMD714 TaxID=3016097 RepID=UPI00249B815C|nr:hypothetical protein [Micromonospora sp. WMMD714]WFE63557.1 hypothetical protein O7625_09800 [Micromonospora sp. WMMD714]